LKELREKGFQGPDKFLVGETPGIGLELAKFLTSKEQKEMDMIFNFDHLETPGHVRFEEYTYDLNYYKTYMIHWMKHYGKDGRMSLFYDNHDNPRMLSKINPEPKYRMILAKLLATMQMTLRGTPFIFQGEEIGMQNAKFRSMDEIKDVESQNRYQELLHKMTPEEAFKNVLSGTRDHARVPMQWTKETYAGFSEYQPWLEGDKDYLTTNVEEQIFDQNSTVHFYKKLIALRNDSLVLKYGDIQFVGEKRKDFFGYFRTPALDEESCKNKKTYFIECNLSNHRIKRQAKKGKYNRILSNYEKQQEKFMQPYEATIYEV
jgi:oligo-1,6-glucosidase